MMQDTFTVEAGGTTYTLRRLSEYSLLKIYGSDRDVADKYCDLIEASLIDPDLTPEEIRNMDGFISLGLAILGQYEDVVRDFPGSQPTG